MNSEDKKPEKCDKCGAGSRKIEFKQMLTFEYWYCKACGEEVDTTVLEKVAEDAKIDLGDNPDTLQGIQKSQASQTNPSMPLVLSDVSDFFAFASAIAPGCLTQTRTYVDKIKSTRVFEFDYERIRDEQNFSRDFSKELFNRVHPAKRNNLSSPAFNTYSKGVVNVTFEMDLIAVPPGASHAAGTKTN